MPWLDRDRRRGIGGFARDAGRNFIEDASRHPLDTIGNLESLAHGIHHPREALIALAQLTLPPLAETALDRIGRRSRGEPTIIAVNRKVGEYNKAVQEANKALGKRTEAYRVVQFNRDQTYGSQERAHTSLERAKQIDEVPRREVRAVEHSVNQIRKKYKKHDALEKRITGLFATYDHTVRQSDEFFRERELLNMQGQISTYSQQILLLEKGLREVNKLRSMDMQLTGMYAKHTRLLNEMTSLLDRFARLCDKIASN